MGRVGDSGTPPRCPVRPRGHPHPGYGVRPSILGLRVFKNSASLGWHRCLHGGTEPGPGPLGSLSSPVRLAAPPPHVSSAEPLPAPHSQLHLGASCSARGSKLRSTVRNPCRLGESLSLSAPPSPHPDSGNDTGGHFTRWLWGRGGVCRLPGRSGAEPLLPRRAVRRPRAGLPRKPQRCVCVCRFIFGK